MKNDIWCYWEPLEKWYPRLAAIDADRRCTVAERVKKTHSGVEFFGCWRRPLREGRERNKFEEVRSLCSRVPLTELDDQWRWELSTTGAFTTSSLRKAFDDMWLRRYGPVTSWNRVVLVKVRVHYWRLKLNRLPIIENLISRGLVLDSSSCPFCNGPTESRDHIFVTCSKAREVHLAINGWWKVFKLNAYCLEEIIDHIDQSQNRGHKRRLFEDVVMLAYLWLIWKGRNEVIFNNISFNSRSIANNVQAIAFLWLQNRCPSGWSISWSEWCCNVDTM